MLYYIPLISVANNKTQFQTIPSFVEKGAWHHFKQEDETESFIARDPEI